MYFPFAICSILPFVLSICFGEFCQTQLESSIRQGRVARENTWINESHVLIDHLKSPNPDVAQAASTKLQRLAKRSRSVRTRIVHRLVSILESPRTPEEEFGTRARSKITYLLGDLQAVEAIDVLVKNLDNSDFPNLSHPSPSVDALINIGRPAVMKLIEVLPHDDPVYRRYAAFALGRIGDGRAVEPLSQALRLEGDWEAKWQIESSLSILSRKKLERQKRRVVRE